ncbi:YchJ family protein [Acaryochloris sp. 'Moss Beach']|uniref:YchJ family protein n=1 Tax=Acaryochloris TaxID=155977 RepID=UPI001BB091FB|nr:MULTISPECIES: YchJ family protein [Acaryochloris]QUY41263.1 YchJ family protein [Acaryochloris marina S15]UJB70432.1 YchJ family protein [Acaryochloris sp. 'Moss Beach']
MLISDDRSATSLCPCGSQKLFNQCCGVYLQGSLPAPTAETLMRSRYVAYCLKNIDYLFNTEHPSHRQPNSRQLIAATANHLTWLGLTVLATKAGQPEDKTGVVEFFAVYQEGNSVAQLHERSRFIKENGKWFYTDGDRLPPFQPKKNEPCWCKSGKKFKQCHRKKI